MCYVAFYLFFLLYLAASGDWGWFSFLILLPVVLVIIYYPKTEEEKKKLLERANQNKGKGWRPSPGLGRRVGRAIGRRISRW